jgi:hypothetical protein
MNRDPVSKDDVAQAIQILRGQGEQPTIERLRRQVGRGSLSTLLALR